MKKDVILSAKSIDESLYRLYRISLDYRYTGDQRTAYVAKVANDTVNWWIGTGRASTMFLKAFVNLSDYRMNTLIKKCVAADAGTESDSIAVIKKYLKVEN